MVLHDRRVRMHGADDVEEFIQCFRGHSQIHDVNGGSLPWLYQVNCEQCDECIDRFQRNYGPIDTRMTRTREDGQAGIEKGQKLESQPCLYHMGARAKGRVQCLSKSNASSMRTVSLHCPPRPVTRELLQNSAKLKVVEGLQTKVYALSSFAARTEHPVTFRNSKSLCKIQSGKKWEAIQKNDRN
jgi:hypothetical protein